MDYSKIQNFLEENKEFSIIAEGVSEKEIHEIEEELEVSLPESYKWFLKEYGSGGAYGTIILGYDFEGAKVVEQTKEYRIFYDLIPGLVVIEYIDEFSYCLDTNRMVDGECPVILWDNHEGYGYTAASNFLEFVLQRLEKGKEDLDEDEDWDD
ncbi:SMI1/KNR4 family protein [Bacillus atrophaeus]|uniref:SMI1/KNR4 family protein n=1 Tax=Bacillus atrophaeus TaxID=1452 RepID=UPI0007792A02|nr:SMI1/KNR4 family protein [Bacillus atrophaeus]KYD02564.1 hypothetical protein B4144_3061 [Bacillus atrophaeus]